MKSFLEIESDRAKYHKYGHKNTVHRSSLLVPRFETATTNISFLNHFILKRKIADVTLKITPLNNEGHPEDALSFEIKEPRVYSLNLDELFKDQNEIKEYAVEFYSDKNLFIPFPAVMVNHVGPDFVNSVHSYNRILNDIFEDDKVNKHQVYESSIDVIVDNEYDTFFNFATGIFKVKDNISVSNSQCKEKKLIPVELERLTNKNYFLSDIFNKELSEGTILKILQPKQSLFYGRLLSGVMNRKTKSFSANHSYYDSSPTEEYFENSQSYRTYPYFPDCQNGITMYPIMSPSTLDIHIELSGYDKKYRSEAKTITSPSNKPIVFNINELVGESGISSVTLFKVVANTGAQKIPTRVNHQLIYESCDSKSKLRCSINTSLFNKNILVPPQKTGFTWGQVLCDQNYESRLGICFDDNFGEPEEISIEFYSKNGLIKSLNQILVPLNSLIFDNEFFKNIDVSNEFIWFVAKSKRPDIRAECFHYDRNTGNASGEHSF